MPDRRPTVADWRPLTEPPAIPTPSQIAVFVFDDRGCRMTALYGRDRDGDGGFFRMGPTGRLGEIVSVVTWAPWPDPPTAEAIARGFAAGPAEDAVDD